MSPCSSPQNRVGGTSASTLTALASASISRSRLSGGGTVDPLQIIDTRAAFFPVFFLLKLPLGGNTSK